MATEHGTFPAGWYSHPDTGMDTWWDGNEWRSEVPQWIADEWVGNSDTIDLRDRITDRADEALSNETQRAK